MTLPLPRLDDKTFAQLMEDARKLIPRYAPEWTDHNTHDPGITFLELFAWLTELQRYYLDQVRDENYLKFLKLVGIRLKDIASATTDVKFSFTDRRELVPILIPQRTKLTTNEQVIFETDTSLLMVPDSLQKVISSCKSGRQDNRQASDQLGLSFYAFGENAEAGSCLYLGFKLYVFDWDNVCSIGFNIDSERLKQFLEIYLGFNWVKNIDNEAIYKNDAGTQIILNYGEQRLTLELDEINNQVKLTFNEAVIDEIYLIVVNENNRRRIYGQPFPIDKSIALTFNLFEDYPVKRGEYAEEELVKIIPSATLAWEYWGSDRLWKKLDVNCDETLNLSQSGRLWFTVPQDLSVRNLFPFTEQLFWLRAVVKEAGYELPPKINNILLNTISATEKDTLSEVTIHSSHHQHVQSFPASYLALIGENIIQVKQFALTLTLLFFNSRLELLQTIFWLAVVLSYESEMQHGYWKDWQNYRLEKNHVTGTITVTFRRKIPPKGKNNIRLISYLEEFDEQRFLGRSNGLPSQSFSLKHFVIVSESLKIQIKQQIEKDYLWKDWIQVKDFDASDPEDPHYVLDAENGKIYFGDGINGDIPPVLDDEYSICVVSCQTSDGEKGNVEAKTINQIFNPVSTLVNTEFICPTKLTVENQRAASGGAPLETLEKAKLRARKSLKQINKAVTSEDFELLALSTPGLRIARIKAIAPPATEAKNLVKVVVVPYSETPIPAKPSSGFLQNVYQHLEPHRLITTKLEVIPPSYVEVKVKALLRIRSGFNPDEVCQQVNQSLIERFLHPLHGGFNSKGWQFGRAVYKSEVYKAIEDFNKGVDCVKTLDLSFQTTDKDTDVTLDRQGNIHISVHTLIYSKKHEISYENQ